MWKEILIMHEFYLNRHLSKLYRPTLLATHKARDDLYVSLDNDNK